MWIIWDLLQICYGQQVAPAHSPVECELLIVRQRGGKDLGPAGDGGYCRRIGVRTILGNDRDVERARDLGQGRTAQREGRGQKLPCGELHLDRLSMFNANNFANVEFGG
jgi:hypothetical protein